VTAASEDVWVVDTATAEREKDELGYEGDD
jgi:hypothetical protein